jgi:hypothetical protein
VPGVSQLEDYEGLKTAKASEEQPAAAATAAEEEEEEEEDSDGSDEDDEDGDLTEEQQAMLEAVIENFTKMKGRAPTELELVAIMNQLNAKIADVDSDEDSDVEEGDLSGGDDDDDEEEEEDEEEDDEEEDDDEEEAEEEMPAAPASVPASARPSRKLHRASVEGTPALRGSKVKAPLPPAPIIRKKRTGAAS